MYIIGDIGNTDIKVCLVNKKYNIIKKKIFNTNKVSTKYLYRNLNFLLKHKKLIKKAIVCSVVPSKYLILKKFFKINLSIKCLELKSLNLDKYIKITVNKKQVGSDRIANALSVIDNNNNYIIIDFGTATTFDVVKKNRYLGGIIAPGVDMSLKNLINKASLIPKVKLTKSKNILGKNTKDAVNSGFYWGYIGLINNIIKLIIKDSNSMYKIKITGGYAYLFKNSIEYICELDKDITLKGLIKLL